MGPGGSEIPRFRDSVLRFRDSRRARGSSALSIFFREKALPDSISFDGLLPERRVEIPERRIENPELCENPNSKFRNLKFRSGVAALTLSTLSPGADTPESGLDRSGFRRRLKFQIPKS